MRRFMSLTALDTTFSGKPRAALRKRARYHVQLRSYMCDTNGADTARATPSWKLSTMPAPDACAGLSAAGFGAAGCACALATADPRLQSKTVRPRAAECASTLGVPQDVGPNALLCMHPASTRQSRCAAACARPLGRTSARRSHCAAKCEARLGVPQFVNPSALRNMQPAWACLSMLVPVHWVQPHA